MNKLKLFFFVAFCAAILPAAPAQVVTSNATSVQFTEQYAIFQRLQTESTPDSARTVSVLVTERFMLTDTLAIDGKIAELENSVKNREAAATQAAGQAAKEKAELDKIKSEYKKKKGKKEAAAPPVETVAPAPPPPAAPQKPAKKKSTKTGGN